jgi:hypothetical protein
LDFSDDKYWVLHIRTTTPICQVPFPRAGPPRLAARFRAASQSGNLHYFGQCRHAEQQKPLRAERFGVGRRRPTGASRCAAPGNHPANLAETRDTPCSRNWRSLIRFIRRYSTLDPGLTTESHLDWPQRIDETFRGHFCRGLSKSGNADANLLAGIVYGLDLSVCRMTWLIIVPDVHYRCYYRRFGTPCIKNRIFRVLDIVA